MIDRLARARAYESKPDVFAVSINAGFEESDIVEIGPTVLVTYEGESAAHQTFAQSIADDIWARRTEVLNTYYTVEAAAVIAADFVRNHGPLIIADYADNPGGGAYGDSTALLDALFKAGITSVCFGPMVDPAVAAYLHQHREGETVIVDLGGKTEPKFGGGPLTVTGNILQLSDGVSVGDGPMMCGQELHFGKTGVLHVDGIDILVVSEAIQMYDQQQFRAFGIDPTSKTIVAVKSMQHFRAAFEPMADKVIVCDSGALCTTDATKLPYQKVPRPIFPLDPGMTL
jgi:microcystin degradation protein MlrC